MNAELLSLPWEIQLTLASGFLGYALAYAGQRDRHGALDTAFLTLAFGLVGGGLYRLAAPETYAASALASIAAVIASLAVGAFWKWRGRQAALWLLRASSVSGSDEAPTAWRSLLERSTEIKEISQISVTIGNGVTYTCQDTSRFNHAPFGNLLLGPDGSVGLYVTHWKGSDNQEVENTTVIDHEWGAEMTFIPANQIRAIEVRMSSA